MDAYAYKDMDNDRRQRLENGAAALVRIDKRQTFLDWYAVGAALGEMEAECQYRSGANSAAGKGYNLIWRVLASEPRLKPLANLDKGTRSCAKWVAAHFEIGPEEGQPGIEEWHSHLPIEIRRMVNHPVAVKRRYLKEHPAAHANTEQADLYAADESEDDEREIFDPAGGEHQDRTKEAIEIKADKDLWRASLREIWEQGEEDWRAEFLAEVSYDDILDGDDAEIDRLNSAAVSEEARANDKVGGVSDEQIGVAVLDAADHIAAVQAGEAEAGDPDFPESDVWEPPVIKPKRRRHVPKL